MADHSTKPPSIDSPQSSHGDLMYLIGRLQGTCDAILSCVMVRHSTEPSTEKHSGLMGANIKRLLAAASTLSVWGKVAMWLAPRAVIMWGLAQGWLQAAWRWLQGWLLALF